MTIQVGLLLFWHGICFYFLLLTTELGLIPPQGQTRLPDALNCQRLEKIVPRSDKAKLMVDPPRPPNLATLPSPGGLLFYVLFGPTSKHRRCITPKPYLFDPLCMRITMGVRS